MIYAKNLNFYAIMHYRGSINDPYHPDPASAKGFAEGFS